MPNHLHISERFLGGNDITHFAQTFNTHVSHQFYYCTSRLSLHYPLIGKPTKHSNSSLNFQFASNYKVARKLDSFFTCVLTITIPSEELNRPNEKSVFTDWSLLLRINHQLLTVSCISLHHRTRSWIWIRTLSSLSLLFPLSEKERAGCVASLMIQRPGTWLWWYWEQYRALTIRTGDKTFIILTVRLKVHNIENFKWS